MSWGSDVTDEPEEPDDEDNDEIPNFPSTFEKCVRGSGSLTDISESDLYSNIDQVEEVDLLKEGWLQAEGERRNIIRKRLEDLDADIENLGDSESTDGDDEEAVETEEQETSDTSDDGWGSAGESDDGDSSESAEPVVESLEEMEGEKDQEEEETDSEAAQGTSGPPQPANSVTLGEAMDRERRWKVMVWGQPKLFKTHFGFTMPEPIAFIDTEGKADDLTRKFQDRNVRVWQPKHMTADPDTKFRRAKKALDEALEWLEWYYENENERGTIVVDSMTLMWEWAQIHHKIENYPMKDPDEVELSANFTSSQESDWAVIKEYHNGEFRERITDSPFHFYWTAMEREAFQETIEDEDNRRFMEPKGEPDNDYKVDTEIHAREDKEIGKVGDLQGSNYVDNKFVGLHKPTFPKVRDAILRIEEAEASEEDITRGQLASEIDAEAVIDFDPQVYIQ